MPMLYGLSDDFWNHEDYASLSDDVHATGAAIKVGYPHTGPGGLTAQADAAIAANEANGLTCIVNLWTTTEDFGGQADPVDYYGDRVEEAAARWPDVLIESINEPNLGDGGGTTRPFGAWTPLSAAQVTAEAVNRAPGRVIGPAIAPWGPESYYFGWQDEMYNHIFDLCDINDMAGIATHAYPIEQFTVEAELERHVERTWAAGREQLPVYFTEIAFQWGYFGDHVNVGNLQPIKSVEFWERYLHDERVGGVFFFRLAPAVASEGGPSAGEIFQRFALSTNQPMEDALEEAWGDVPDPLPGPSHEVVGWPLPGGTYPARVAAYPSASTSYPSMRVPPPAYVDSEIAVAVQATVGENQVELPIISGQVDLDSNAASHGRLTLEVPAEPEWIPTKPDDLLAPYGNEIRVYRGTQDNLTPLGVYRIQSTTINDPGATISIEALDRSIMFIDEPFYQDENIPGGEDPMEWVLSFLSGIYPELQYTFAESNAPTVAHVAYEGDDRWEYCQGVLATLTGELYFDRYGTLIGRPITQSLSGATATYSEGEDGNLISIARNWDRSGLYNKVIVTGENSSLATPPRGEAVDDNPQSPTYWYKTGPMRFGHKTYRWTNSWIENDDQAESAARGILLRSIGAPEIISFNSLVDVERWPGDVVKVTRERLGVDQFHVIDSMSIPLGFSGEMSMTTRKLLEGPS